MGINFDKVPTSPKEDAYKAVPGTYLAKIIEAKMRPNKDTTKKDYLNLTYELSDPKTLESKGKMFDILSESDSDIVLYKIGRFATALGLHLTGTVELQDLAKVCVNKSFVVNTKIKKSDERYLEVDVFDALIYMSTQEYNASIGEADLPFDTDEEVPQAFQPVTNTDVDDAPPIPAKAKPKY